VIQDEFQLSRISHCGAFLSTVGRSWSRTSDGCVCSRCEQAVPLTLFLPLLPLFSFQTYQVLTIAGCLANPRRTSSSSRKLWVRMLVDSSVQSHRRRTRTSRTPRTPRTPHQYHQPLNRISRSIIPRRTTITRMPILILLIMVPFMPANT
jgi:hypothetical protein